MSLGSTLGEQRNETLQHLLIIMPRPSGLYLFNSILYSYKHLLRVDGLQLLVSLTFMYEVLLRIYKDYSKYNTSVQRHA